MEPPGVLAQMVCSNISSLRQKQCVPIQLQPWQQSEDKIHDLKMMRVKLTWLESHHDRPKYADVSHLWRIHHVCSTVKHNTHHAQHKTSEFSFYTYSTSHVSHCVVLNCIGKWLTYFVFHLRGISPLQTPLYQFWATFTLSFSGMWGYLQWQWQFQISMIFWMLNVIVLVMMKMLIWAIPSVQW